MNASVRPSVLILGGFATVPPNYWPFRDRLAKRDVARLDIAQLWPPDWAISAMLGFGPIMRRTGTAIARTYHMGGRRPIIVVAHSGGGIAARMAMSPVAYYGRIAGVAEAVGCLVTLGAPHHLDAMANRYHHAGHDATEFLNRETPGAFFAPRTQYLSVGSAFPQAAFDGVVGRLAEEVFSMIVGTDMPSLGDGIVPVAAVHLDGAEQITFDDVRHGMIGTPWYGDDEIIDRWWPTATRLWHEALDARASGRAAPSSAPSEASGGAALAEMGAKP